MSGTDDDEKATMSEMVEAYENVTQHINLTKHMTCNGKTILFKSVPFDGIQLVLNFWVSSLGVNIDYKISQTAIYMDGYDDLKVLALIQQYPIDTFKLRD